MCGCRNSLSFFCRSHCISHTGISSGALADKDKNVLALCRLEAMEDIDLIVPDNGRMTEHERTVMALSLGTAQRDCDADDAKKSGSGVRGGGKESVGFGTVSKTIPTTGDPINDDTQFEEIYSNLSAEAAEEKKVAVAFEAANEKTKVIWISITTSYGFTAARSAPSLWSSKVVVGLC